jgi:hypothetical protein
VPKSQTIEQIVVKASTVYIHGTHFRAETPRACIIIQGAAGVAQSRYADLSAYLAGEGISVIT